MSALNNLIHTKPSSTSTSSPLLQPPSHKHHRRPSVKKLVKKLTKVRHSKAKGTIQVVEHGSVMKGIHQLQAGEVKSYCTCSLVLMQNSWFAMSIIVLVVYQCTNIL